MASLKDISKRLEELLRKGANSGIAGPGARALNPQTTEGRFARGLIQGGRRIVEPVSRNIATAGLTLGSVMNTKLAGINFLPDNFQRRQANLAQTQAELALQNRRNTGLEGSGFTKGGAKTAWSGLGAAARPALAAIGINSPALLTSSALFSGGLSGAISKVTGSQDVAGDIGRSVGYSPVYAGIGKVFNPVEEKIANAVVGSAPSAKATFATRLLQNSKRGLTKGTIYGILNTLEDEALTPLLEGKDPTTQERLVSFGVGLLAGFVPEVRKTWGDKKVSQFVKYETDRVVNKRPKYPQEPVWVGDMREANGLPRNGEYTEADLPKNVREGGYFSLGKDNSETLNITGADAIKQQQYMEYKNRLLAQGVPQDKIPPFGEKVEGAKASGYPTNIQESKLAQNAQDEVMRRKTLLVASQIEDSKTTWQKINEAFQEAQNKIKPDGLELPQSVREGGGIQINGKDLDPQFAVKPSEFSDVPTYKRSTQPQVDALAKLIKSGEVKEDDIIGEISEGRLNQDIFQRANEKAQGLELLTKFNEALEENKLEEAQNTALKVFESDPTDPISAYKTTIQKRLADFIGKQPTQASKVNDPERGSIQLGSEKLNTILSKKQSQTPSNKSIADQFEKEMNALNETSKVESSSKHKPMTVSDLFNLVRKKGVETENTKAKITDVTPDADYKRTAAVLAEDQPQIFEKAIRKYVGGKNVAKTEGGEIGLKYKEAFKDLPSNEKTFTEFMNHVEGVKKSSNPQIVKTATEWKQDTDALYNQIKTQATRAGLKDLGYIDDYATHYWKQDDATVKNAFEVLSKKNPSMKERSFKSYQQGIEYGLTPKYTQPERVMAEYVQRLYNTKNSLDLFENLKKENLIVEGSIGRSTKGFEPVNAPGFPRKTTTLKGVTVDSPYYAPSDVARKINKIFTPQNYSTKLKFAADASKRFQNISLSGGTPKAPINAFYIAQIQKEMLSGNFTGPLKIFAIASSPQARVKYQMDNADVMKEMQRNNVLSSTGITPEMLGKPTTAGDAWDRVMTDPTFKWGMPMLQIEHYKNIKNQAVKQGLSNDEAIKVASKSVNNFYGLIDPYKQVMSNPDIENAKNTFLFAPYYRQAMINFWANNIRALKNPLALENRANVKFIVGASITYGVMSGLNQMLNGHPMSENPENKKDKLLIPAGDKTIGIPFLSSIATVPRGLIRIGGKAVKGDYAGMAKDTFQTFASMAVKPLGDIANNEDYFGRPIYEENANAIEKQKSVVKYLGKQIVAHPWIKAAIERVENGSPENALDVFETISTAGEMPFRFYDTESVLNSPFWEKWNTAKTANEYYRKLKYDDPVKAEEYYNNNQTLLNDYPVMKKAVDSYFDEGDAKALVEYMGGDKPQYETSDDAPQTFTDKTILFGKSAIANPIQTFQAVSNNEPLRKLRGGPGVMGFLDSSTVSERKLDIGNLDYNDKTSQVDHIIPKWLGGRETDGNYQILSNEDHAKKNKYETQLRSQYEAGEIKRSETLKLLNEFNDSLTPITKEEKTATKKKSTDTTKEAFKESDKQTDLIDGVYYIKGITDAGNVSVDTIDLNKPLKDPKLTPSNTINKKLISTFNSDITKRQNDVLKLLDNGLLSMEEAVARYEYLEARRLKKAGSGKGKKKKATKITWTPKKLSTQKFSAPKTPTINIKAKKLPTLKAQKSSVAPIKISGFRNDLASGFTKLV